MRNIICKIPIFPLGHKFELLPYGTSYIWKYECSRCGEKEDFMGEFLYWCLKYIPISTVVIGLGLTIVSMV